MAIQSRTINSSLTEIYVVGENFITQASPTNFHKFWTKKILTSSENIEDFKEVTSAEKTTIENKDKEWEEPSEDLIAQCKSADTDILYNTKTGYFEYNGLTDITTKQMRDILFSPWAIFNNRVQCPINIRTNLVPARIYTRYAGIDDFVNLMTTFVGAGLEVLKLSRSTISVYVSSITTAFVSCKKLKYIIGVLDLLYVSTDAKVFNAFGGCTALEDVQLKNLKCSISFSYSPLLSLDSIQYLVTNAANTSPITVTLHPDAYARLTDEIITAATAKQINFATETA